MQRRRIYRAKRAHFPGATPWWCFAVSNHDKIGPKGRLCPHILVSRSNKHSLCVQGGRRTPHTPTHMYTHTHPTVSLVCKSSQCLLKYVDLKTFSSLGETTNTGASITQLCNGRSFLEVLGINTLDCSLKTQKRQIRNNLGACRTARNPASASKISAPHEVPYTTLSQNWLARDCMETYLRAPHCSGCSFVHIFFNRQDRTTLDCGLA